MKKMMAAYWHADNLDIYSYEGEKPVKYASGPIAGLQPVKRGLGIKVLVVGRGRLMRIRKRYPPAPKEKLAKAVAMEITEIFPFTKPAFYCRIFRTISNYVELDIWAWEADSYAGIQEIFPFTHVIPEDVLFTAVVPEVRIFQYTGLVSMLAHGPGRFLDSASLPLAGFDAGQVSRFLFNLGQVGEEIKKVVIYGLPQFPVKSAPGMELVRSEESLYPPCLEGIAQASLGEFKIGGGYRSLPLPPPALVMRIGLYLVLGYGLMLFLTLNNYNQAMTDIRKRMADIDKKNVTLAASQPSLDYTDVVREVNARIQKSQGPLKTINMLAQQLPKESFINRIMLTDNNLELQVASKIPLTVVKTLGGVDSVKKATIKGAPYQERGTGLYNFVVILELAK